MISHALNFWTFLAGEMICAALALWVVLYIAAHPKGTPPHDEQPPED